MVRFILTFVISVLCTMQYGEAQSNHFPGLPNYLVEWGIIKAEKTIFRDTLDPKKADRLAAKATRAEKRIARAKERKIKDIHKNIDPEKVMVPRGNKKLALSLFDNQLYGAALDAFSALSQEEKANKDIMVKIATAYQKNAQPKAAEYWYGRVVKTTNAPEHQLAYARVLQMNQKCEDATYWYSKYAEQTDIHTESMDDFLRNCTQANQIQSHDGISINNATSLNTEYLDFAPIPVGNGVIFTSSRKSDRFQVNQDCWTQENYTDLFIAEGNACEFDNISTLDGAVNGRFHDGVASFAAGGNIMFFTRNNYKGKSKDGVIDLKIWQSVKRDGVWSKAEELPFNSDHFTSCHPALSSDGQRLYFASNRPGGYGGLDLYVAHLVDGKWEKPINLGAEINSEGNDIFPFIDENENLFYSSSGFAGVGGLDLFKAEKARVSDENSWQNRRNMGIPFNSENDDFGFYTYPGGENGFLTSNRDGGLGGDDIYCWEGSMQPKESAVFAANFCVSDEGSGELVENANVHIENMAMATASIDDAAFGDMILTLKPLDDGKYALGVNRPLSQQKNNLTSTSFATRNSEKFDLEVDKTALYKIAIQKSGYENYTATFTGEELLAREGKCLAIKKESCYAIQGKVKLDDATLSSGAARVVIFDRTMNKNMEVVVDEHGNYETCVPCGHEYRINGRLDGFDSNYRNLTSADADCGAGVIANSDIYLNKRKIISRGTYVETYTPSTPATVHAAPCNPCGYFVPCHNCTTPCANCQPKATTVSRKTKLKRETPDEVFPFEAGYLKEGSVIRLEGLQYDYNKYDIRPDAKYSLEKLLELMNTESEMHVEMRSHTDARGNAYYNDWLSLKRAEAARSYLISRGINCDRISVKGFGERRLLNNCDDDAECEESSHQSNRRTEFKITRFN